MVENGCDEGAEVETSLILTRRVVGLQRVGLLDPWDCFCTDS